MIFDIMFIVLLWLFGTSSFYWGAGMIFSERDKSPDLVAGTTLARWVACILFCVLMFMVVPL